MEQILPIYRLYESWFDADLDGLVGAVDEGIEVDHRDVLPYRGSYHGRTEYRQLLTQLAGGFSLLDIAPDEFLAGDGFVLVSGRYFGVGDAGLLDATFMHLWRMRQGLPVALGAYADPAEAWAAIDRHDLGSAV